MLDFVRALLLFSSSLLFSSRLLSSPLLSLTTAPQLPAPDSTGLYNCKRMIAVGTTGPQLQAPDRSGHCRTSTHNTQPDKNTHKHKAQPQTTHNTHLTRHSHKYNHKAHNHKRSYKHTSTNTAITNTQHTKTKHNHNTQTQTPTQDTTNNDKHTNTIYHQPSTTTISKRSSRHLEGPVSLVVANTKVAVALQPSLQQRSP